MKKGYLLTLIVASAAIITFTSVQAYATYVRKTMPELAAEVTGQTVDQLIAERETSGKTIGQILADEGKLDEFNAAKLAELKLQLNDDVTSGKLTQAEADAIYLTRSTNIAACDGTGVNTQKGSGIGMMGSNYGSGTGTGTRAGGMMGNRNRTNQ